MRLDVYRVFRDMHMILKGRFVIAHVPLTKFTLVEVANCAHQSTIRNAYHAIPSHALPVSQAISSNQQHLLAKSSVHQTKSPFQESVNSVHRSTHLNALLAPAFNASHAPQVMPTVRFLKPVK
jgi:hypothetical protein